MGADDRVLRIRETFLKLVPLLDGHSGTECRFDRMAGKKAVDAVLDVARQILIGAAHGNLWNRAISSSELEHRLDDSYRPYHRAIKDELSLVADRFGCALLLDCHSMPPSKGSAQIVFGDRFGRSAAPWLVSEAMAVALDAGFSAATNDPFAGGHIVDRHSSPQTGIHAIQLEIDRRCYLDGNGQPGNRFDDVAALIETLAKRLGAKLLDRRMAEAAE